ncbi:MAG: VWA domain-containing protein [Actinobacteria bacterium]|nr:VWA domain-containing protein [Actinomycetota bacterium]
MGARPASGGDRLAVAFGRVLRGLGLRVPIHSVIDFSESLGLLGIDRRESVYWAGRSTLVRRPEDLPLFDRAFAVFWDRHQGGADTDDEDEITRITLAIDDDEDDRDDPDQGEAEANDDPTLTLRFSALETLRHKDFAAYDDDELVLAQDLMSSLRFAGPPRRSYRSRPSTHGHEHDLRRTVRSSLRAGGEPIRRHWREPGDRLRRLVLLLDVSGSMEPYARGMLRFVHAAVAGRQRVEAFAMGTRLTRITRELSSRDPDKALREASARVLDWSGGTRLGECLTRFNDEWGVRGMARGAIVVVLSDGWDRGDPAVLAEQMARLDRIAFRTVWVNPLKVTPGYAPLARGMAAALPYVDAFVEGHSVAAMEELAATIGALRTEPRGSAHRHQHRAASPRQSESEGVHA